MYLIDTNVISELSRHRRANRGVRRFLDQAVDEETPLYLSVITIGELRRGTDLIRHRGDKRKADRLQQWLGLILEEYQDHLLGIDADVAQLWGRLRVLRPEHIIDKLIAATAIIYGLTVVTRNEADFVHTGVPVLNPFDA